MSKYTITIKKLIDNDFDFQLDEYPIFDEAYRNTLNKKILDHYYMDEIGFETPALFRHFLKHRLDVIMPRYNVLYEAQVALARNPLGDTDLTESMSRQVENTGTSNSESESKGKNLFQDTPSSELVQTDIDDAKWASNITHDKTNSNDTTSTRGNSTEAYTKHLFGNNGKKYNIDVYEKLTQKFLSIDEQIIEDLNDLFMGLL